MEASRSEFLGGRLGAFGQGLLFLAALACIPLYNFVMSERGPSGEPGQLPNLTEPYTLAEGAAATFRDLGWVSLRGLLSEREAKSWLLYVDSSVKRWNLPQTGPTGAFHRVDNSWQVDDVMARFSLAPRLGKVAGELMGCSRSGVRLYKETHFRKAPSHRSSPWHQDHIATPISGKELLINCWITLTQIDDGMSQLLYAEGSQVERLPLYSKEEDSLYDAARERHPNIGSAGSMAPGDATCHQGWTMHRADANHGSTPRKAISLMFYCNGTKAATHDELSERSSDDLGAWKRWFETGGLRYGRSISTPLSPLVYPPSQEWKTARKLKVITKWDTP